MKKVLLTATVYSHIAQFHKPLINMLKDKGYEIHVAGRDNLIEKKVYLLKMLINFLIYLFPDHH